jgi:hypothetical protein
MTPYEKRFQSRQPKYRTITKQAKASENPADITWVDEPRAPVVVKAPAIIKRPSNS